MQIMATCYKRLSFSNEEEFKLIEFIKKHPALWDASHGEYGNSELRKLYWISLATELNKSVFECRRKWRFVRDYYIHKRRRQPQSTPQRDGKYYSLQFLNKVKVSSKKFPSQNSDEIMGQTKNSKRKKNFPNTLEKIEVDYVDDSDEEIDYDFLDDPALQITVERIDENGDQKYSNLTTNNDDQELDGIANNDDKSDEFSFKEDYIDEESSVAGGEFSKLQNENIEEIDEVEEQEQEQQQEDEHLMIDTSNDNNVNFAQGTTQTENNNTSSLLHEKAIDLFFQSMAAAIKTFPPQYVAEAKCKVFMAFNEIETKVYKNANKN